LNVGGGEKGREKGGKNGEFPYEKKLRGRNGKGNKEKTVKEKVRCTMHWVPRERKQPVRISSGGIFGVRS